MKRIELKFLTDNSYLKKNRSNFFSLHPPRVIKNIYFDTEILSYYRLSEEGVTPRLKVRLRSYDNSNIQNLEIKYTFATARDKVSISNFEHNKNNLNSTLRQFNINKLLKPTVKVTYTRDYFKCKYGRLTYDYNIYYEKINNNFDAVSKKFFENNNVIELKTNNLHLNKQEVFNFVNIYESRNSKYCNAIEKIYFNNN